MTLTDALDVQTDTKAAGLCLLFGVVITGALLVRPEAVAGGTTSAVDGASTSQKATAGVAWALAEAAFAGILLGGVVLWRRFPEWLQEALWSGVKFGVPMAVGIAAASVSAGGFWLAVAVGMVIIGTAIDAFDCYWIINNILAVALAIYVGVAAGVVLGAVVIGVGLIGLTIYDYVFADRESWMFDLAGWTLRNRLPALFIVPSTWRLDWDDIATGFESDADTDPDEIVSWGIGMADLALPAAFVVALAHGGSALPAYGAALGVFLASTRISKKLDDGGGAGLPPITSGALGGWAVAAGLGVML